MAATYRFSIDSTNLLSYETARGTTQSISFIGTNVYYDDLNNVVIYHNGEQVFNKDYDLISNRDFKTPKEAAEFIQNLINQGLAGMNSGVLVGALTSPYMPYWDGTIMRNSWFQYSSTGTEHTYTKAITATNGASQASMDFVGRFGLTYTNGVSSSFLRLFAGTFNLNGSLGSNVRSDVSGNVFITSGSGYIQLSATGPGVLLGQDSTADGVLRFYNASNSNYVGISTGITGSSYDLILPTDQAAAPNYVLANDGAGVLSWIAATTGSVTSVSGTANRITSTGGTTPVIDIAATYVGQASITTLGTIATGTWQATPVALAYGGTNANLTASNGGIFYSTATAGAILAGTATAGQMLRSGATAAPTWSTATFPNTATTTGAYLRADGTNWITSTLILPNAATTNQIVYASATNTYGANTNFVWDVANSRLGVGTSAPGQTFQVTSSGFGSLMSGSNAGTALTNVCGLEISNTNATTNNYAGISFADAQNASGSALMGVQFTDRTNHYGDYVFGTRGADGFLERWRIHLYTWSNTGSVGTAYIHLRAGTATASTAPLKFTSGTNLTTAETGAMEYNNTFHLTNSDATRRHIVTAPNTTKVVAGAPYANDGYIVMNIGGTDFKIMTTA